MINVPKIIFVLGFGVILIGAVLMGERLADPNIKCVRTFKKRAIHYVLPISIIALGISIIVLDIALFFLCN
ncbi:MAG: hypothetical protein IKT41_01915 [Clostridia bacterium]|nr:hypothetical protein [Clostridia bacterium]